MNGIAGVIVIAAFMFLGIQVCRAGGSRAVVEREDIREGFSGFVWKYDGGEMPYRIHLPAGYDGKQKFPLVLFLHGAGERGSDNWLHMRNNAVWRNAWTNGPNVKTRDQVIILAPQCPANRQWVNMDWSQCTYDLDRTRISEELKAVYAILEHVIKTRKVDTSRLYITGISMGGYGTWDMLARYHGFFVAAAPVCGGGSVKHADKMASTPLWVFHGDADNVVPVLASRLMVDALRKAKSDVKYTEYPGVGHDSWNNAYTEPDFVSWFLSQVRK